MPRLRTWIDTLSLHDALPIFVVQAAAGMEFFGVGEEPGPLGLVDFGHPLAGPGGLTCGRQVRADFDQGEDVGGQDRKSTRLNSSHLVISYAGFCLKKKNKEKT